MTPRAVSKFLRSEATSRWNGDECLRTPEAAKVGSHVKFEHGLSGNGHQYQTWFLQKARGILGTFFFFREQDDEHHAIAPASDADMLRHLLDAKGISPAELSRQTGIAKSSVSEILAGKRPFSRQMIRKLANHFRVDVSVLAANL
jgi:lambda repressor-like predicted transcriptional regulator